MHLDFLLLKYAKQVICRQKSFAAEIFTGIIIRTEQPTMSFNNLFYAWIILHVALCSTSVAETIIWRNQEDVFEIPQEMCWIDTERQCNSMGGRQLIHGTSKYLCTCQCNVNDMNVFGWFDNQWKCGRNSAVRNLVDHNQDCTVKRFDGKMHNATLKTVVFQNEWESQWIGKVVTNYRYCKIESSFAYLDCNSIWKEVNRKFFDLSYTQSGHRLYIFNKKYIDEANYGQQVYGQIIKVVIKCNYYRFGWYTKTYCVVFKVDGTQKCAVVYPTIPTAPTTNSPSTTITTATTEATTTAATTTAAATTTTTTTTTASPPQTTTTNSPFSMTQSTSHSFSTHPHSTYIPAIPKTKESTFDSTTRNPNPIYGTDKPIKHNRDASTDGKGGRGGIIAGVVGGLVGFIAILVILVFLWFKRKRNYHPNRATTQEIAHNDVYDEVVLDNHSSRPPGQLPSAEDEYSYPYMDTHPIVIKDQTGTALQAQNVPNARVNLKTNSGSPIYHTLEDPDYTRLNAANHTEGSYNVLERQPEAGWKTPSNPEGAGDKTLEDPSYSKIHKPNKRHRRSEPSYNVLKRGPVAKCNQQNEPYYDALVKPESSLGLGNNPEAPIYNTLEDPNDVSLKKAGVLGNLNSKQKCPIYNVLEGPNTAHSPVYAELEKPGSKENHVCGALQNDDPHICGALNSPTSGNAGLDYNDDYSNVEDVIYHNDVKVVDSTVYQELNQNRQSSREKQYKPLRHSKVFIGMKDMKSSGHSQT